MSRLVTEALVVRTVEYGESDLVVTFLTEATGKLGAIVRGGRKSQKRVGGALEPFHSIEVTLEDKRGDLSVLREARLVRMRHAIVTSLDAMDAAGTALRWARHLFPPRTREVDGYAEIVGLLDRLEAGAPPKASLAASGLRLLAAVGYALDFERCVVCGKPCPPGKASGVDAGRGGLVCRSCGGGRRTMRGEARAVAQAFQRGEEPTADAEQVDLVLALVDEAMAAHAEFER